MYVATLFKLTLTKATESVHMILFFLKFLKDHTCFKLVSKLVVNVI